MLFNQDGETVLYLQNVWKEERMCVYVWTTTALRCVQ